LNVKQQGAGYCSLAPTSEHILNKLESVLVFGQTLALAGLRLLNCSQRQQLRWKARCVAYSFRAGL
jgi:hypothetical protein